MRRRAEVAADSPRPISTLGALISVLAEQRARAIVLMACSFVSGLAEAATLALVAQVAAALVKDSSSATSALGPLHLDASVSTLLAVAAVLMIVRIGLAVVIAYLPAVMTADTQASQRARLFDAYSRADWDTQAEERDGHLQELVTSQVVQATQAMMNAANLVSYGFMFLTLVVTAFAIGPLVALLVLVIVTGLSLLLRPLGRRGRRHSQQLSAAQLAFAGRVGTAVRLAEETYTFDAEAAERAEVGERIDVAREHFTHATFDARLVQGVFQCLVVLLLIGALAVLYVSGTGQIAGLGAAVLLLVRASSYGQQLQFSWQVIQQTAPFLERLRDAEIGYRAHVPRSGPQQFPTRDSLVIERVEFSYRGDRDEPVLRDVTFEVLPGEVVGIIGPSGAGKSTLVQLLLRMRTPTAGKYLIGALPVDDIDLGSWRSNVAYVPQEPRLRDATVADNVRFHRDIDQASIEQAARLANIHDDIVAMPRGYETIIGQRADAVSGGQRQRLCLARALAGGPSVLVLDEPTSALDRASEAAIQASLQELKGRLTMFIVAHRPSLLAICDRVLEVNSGRVRVLDQNGSAPATDSWQGVSP
jgi:ABC-type multidrug transport system fused ATPase/permease subunit